MCITEELKGLIKLAQGDRTLTGFAKECNISAGNLSKILRGINPNPPTANTLQKIANHAQNDVTIEKLMIASGYLPGTVDASLIKEKLDSKDKKYIDKRIDEIKIELLNNPENFMFSDGTPLSPKALESFINTVEVALYVAKLKNKKYTPKKYKK